MFIIQRIINKEFIFNKVKKDLIIQFIYYLKARDLYLVTKIDQTLVEHEKALAIDPLKRIYQQIFIYKQNFVKSFQHQKMLLGRLFKSSEWKI
ncbi:unnamed protein product [Paramecium primaurelia]|uniref:Uncharacterized protein n=1 Tax=Paramecium primaurelia TaxID=5886 RepID=A0A8S1QB77_PARPR|nr:unnamed protein product [Paramecium primaurelia]